MAAKRTIAAYAILSAVALLVLMWQGFEHSRARRVAEESLRYRALDISNSLAVVIRSQSRFGIIPQEHLEAALMELTKARELEAVALLNASGEVIGAAGELPAFDIERIVAQGAYWTEGVLAVMNPVDFGQMPDQTEESGSTAATVISLDQEYMRAAHDRFRNSDFAKRLREQMREGRPPKEWEGPDGPPPPPGLMRPPDEESDGTAEQSSGERRRGRGGPPPDMRGQFRRPPWIDQAEYDELIEKRGVHWVLLGLSADNYNAECTRDFRLRAGLALITLVAVFGLGIAWHYLDRFTQLQMRLVRASEMNTHLREMNIAAAGLAHETRNPLNLIRGMAQVIAGHQEAGGEIRERSAEIVEEVDRITARLNQFMDYSKPPEAHPTPTDLKKVLRDVARTLEGELEDKQGNLEILGEDFNVEADESLVRQVIFNLLLNAIQAIGEAGHITFSLKRTGKGEACFEINDDGPGVPPDAVDKVFRPYFTTSEKGVGLGLAVVRQIVLVHQWDIMYSPGSGGGACFRVSGLTVC